MPKKYPLLNAPHVSSCSPLISPGRLTSPKRAYFDIARPEQFTLGQQVAHRIQIFFRGAGVHQHDRVIGLHDV